MNITETIITNFLGICFLAVLVSPIIVIIIYLKREKEYKEKNNLPNVVPPPFQQQSTTQQNTISPYTINNFLLTSHEANFYKDLKPIADKYNLIIFCKMRMADILNVKSFIRGKEFYHWFQRISQKHIDFVLCNQSFIPAVLIEIDDSTHNRSDRKESDNFKNAIFKNTNLNLLRYRNWNVEDIERDIKICLFGFEAIKKEAESNVKI